jgi:hypothetical protein
MVFLTRQWDEVECAVQACSISMSRERRLRAAALAQLLHVTVLLISVVQFGQASAGVAASTGWLAGARRLQSAAGDAYVLPLTGKHGTALRRGRQLMRVASMPLGGSVREVG